MSSIALHIVGLVRCLPPAEQAEVRKALAEMPGTEIYGEPWTDADTDEAAQAALIEFDANEVTHAAKG